MEQIEHKIAELVKASGGRVFYVGGFVRDKILGIDNKDVDIEVHGITPEKLLEILETLGHARMFGESFGVYSLDGYDIDIAMPRKEHATGRGHRDFEVSVDPFIGVVDAARRRDFTVNALMEDVLTGEIIDSFGGLEDLKEGILRHVDDISFAEDPLRVLRGAQFASRFSFTIHDDTLKLCQSIDISMLSKERIEGELKKALLKGCKPSIFFESLRDMNQLDTWFTELKALIGLEQDKIFHPEGDVWTHTMEVIDRGAAFRGKVSNPYAFMLLCLTHDLGKIITTEAKDGRIHAYEHETKGLPIIEEFLHRITNDKEVISYVRNMVPLHMRPNVVAYSKVSTKTTNKMFDEAVSPKDLIYFSMSDKPVISGAEPFTGDSGFLFERLTKYEEIMAKPYVNGQDLINAGLIPGEHFSDILAYAHKLRLAGIDKDAALKQTISYANKGMKNELKQKQNRGLQ